MGLISIIKNLNLFDMAYDYIGISKGTDIWCFS